MSGTTTAYFTHDHGDNPVILRTADNVDTLVDAMLQETATNSVAALYADDRPLRSDLPDHELRIAINAEAKVGGIRYAGGDSDGTWYVPGQTSARDEVFYYYMGHDEGWPQDSEVPIEQVRAAIKDFVARDGSRPSAFDWSVWPPDGR